ncbi:hypothetical protein LTR78_010622 [Recurvomyces mirabilis]|uniref:Uncharacterized protein n=1 Tax=Recurvomyces mirabilis TaxID=574656 RepID=A0AAE0TPG7_9PEZI|nr:hypothetical protein LTR78_010622 [Recurvomyces mirabilis]KAK5160203.1 hypothetical protein LTS14_002310 [Recurvomyces mirabilis]
MTKKGKAPLSLMVRIIDTAPELTVHDGFFKVIIGVLREHVEQYKQGFGFVVIELRKGTICLMFENIASDGPVKITACDTDMIRTATSGREVDESYFKALLEKIGEGCKQTHIIHDCPDLSTGCGMSRAAKFQQKQVEKNAMRYLTKHAEAKVMKDFLWIHIYIPPGDYAWSLSQILAP